MEPIDVLHIDEEENILYLVGANLERKGMTHAGTGSLQGLEESLRKYLPKVNLVDGNFPQERGGIVSTNYPRAVQMIRDLYPDAVIYMYSSSMDAAELAKQFRTEFLDKGEYSPKKVAEILEKVIKG